MSGAPIRVLLVDDQRLVRSGFATILSIEDDIVVIGESGDGAAAIEAVRATGPDVVLMDVQMPVMDGIEATRRIVAESESRVIILTTFEDDNYVFAGLAAGASGFMLKNAEPEQLVDAVRAVARGHALLAPEVTGRVLARLYADRAAPAAPAASGASDPTTTAAAATDPGPVHPRSPDLSRLTDREHEVLILLARGMSNAEIARHLFLGEATVKTHVSNCLSKLGLRDRIQAVVLATESGLILPGDPTT